MANPAAWPVQYAHWDVTADATMASRVHAKQTSAVQDVIADVMTGSPAHVHILLESASEIVTADAKKENHAQWLTVNATANADAGV